LALDDVDDVFGDVGGVVADAFAESNAQKGRRLNSGRNDRLICRTTEKKAGTGKDGHGGAVPLLNRS
jgi:hypothetical protein